MMMKPLKPLKRIAVLKSVGPKLVPFFKTVAIFFVLFGQESKLDSIIYCIFKCLPIFSLMIFVLLHGMNFTEAYSYSRKILIGLMFSALGDALLVWKNQGYFIPGVFAFAAAQFMYAMAFQFRPFKFWVGLVCASIGTLLYLFLLPGLHGVMVYVAIMYATLIMTMLWRAVARVQIFNDLWVWTKLCSCAGAISFVISDFVICYDKFMSPVPYAHNIIMVTYYAAQMGITLSVVDSQVDAFVKETTEESIVEQKKLESIAEQKQGPCSSEGKEIYEAVEQTQMAKKDV